MWYKLLHGHMTEPVSFEEPPIAGNIYVCQNYFPQMDESEQRDAVSIVFQ
jgi:hypothetical protein